MDAALLHYYSEFYLASMTCLKLEVGYPACSELCQHPSCWPSFSPAPSNRGLQHPRMKRLLQAQSRQTDTEGTRALATALPTLKILDIGQLSAVGPLASPSPSPTHIFPAVSSSRKAARTATHSRRSRCRSDASVLFIPVSPSPRRTPAPPRPEPALRSLSVRLNYVTVHDPRDPLSSAPIRQLTWHPPSPDKPARAKPSPQVSPMKNVTSQLIAEGFEDEGDVISLYPRACALPALRPCWLSWEGGDLSLAGLQPCGTADEQGALLSSRSNSSYLSNRELFLSGRGLWRPKRKSKCAASLSRALPADSSPPAGIPAQPDPPQLTQISISLDSIPFIPKRIPVVLERFLSHPSPPKLPPQIKVPSLPLEADEDRYPSPETAVLSAPPPTPNCSQDLPDLSERRSMDLYQLLNCPRSASTEQIQAEFRALARAAHPDKATDKTAARDFSLVTQARDILTDSSLRLLYDSWLSSELPVSFQEFRSREGQIAAATHFATEDTNRPKMLQTEVPAKPWKRGKQQQNTCSLTQFRENKI